VTLSQMFWDSRLLESGQAVRDHRPDLTVASPISDMILVKTQYSGCNLDCLI
jgi:hypothetical protein